MVLLLTAVFHVAGAVAASRFNGMSGALHAAGSAALGAGIALMGQIYHLSEHWPSAIMLWALGTALAWLLLRHWTQAAFTAVLTPFWVGAEWQFFSQRTRTSFIYPLGVGLCSLSLAYLGGRRGARDDTTRKALAWIGALGLIPSALMIAVDKWGQPPDWRPQALAWVVAIAGPLLVAFALRGFDLLWNAGALGWPLILAWINWAAHGSVAVYLWGVAGAVGLVLWGIRESRPERVNVVEAASQITESCKPALLGGWQGPF